VPKLTDRQVVRRNCLKALSWNDSLRDGCRVRGPFDSTASRNVALNGLDRPAIGVTPASCSRSDHKVGFSPPAAVTLFACPDHRIRPVVLTGAYALRELKVGGPALCGPQARRTTWWPTSCAAVLLIEAYLEATLCARDPKSLRPHETSRPAQEGHDERKRSVLVGSQPALKTMLSTADTEVRSSGRTSNRAAAALRGKGGGKADTAYARFDARLFPHPLLSIDAWSRRPTT